MNLGVSLHFTDKISRGSKKGKALSVLSAVKLSPFGILVSLFDSGCNFYENTTASAASPGPKPSATHGSGAFRARS